MLHHITFFDFFLFVFFGFKVSDLDTNNKNTSGGNNSGLLRKRTVLFVFSHPFRGRRGVFSLGVQSLHIESLGLRSLRRVSGGLVLVHNNSKLCYTSSLPWAALLFPSQELNLISNNNRDPNTCGNELSCAQSHTRLFKKSKKE